MQRAWFDDEHGGDESLVETLDDDDDDYDDGDDDNYDEGDDDDDDYPNICRELGLTANAIFIQREKTTLDFK